MNFFKSIAFVLLVLFSFVGCETQNREGSSKKSNINSEIEQNTTIKLAKSLQGLALHESEETFLREATESIKTTIMNSISSNNEIDKEYLVSSFKSTRLLNNDLYSSNLKAFYTTARISNEGELDSTKLYNLLSSVLNAVYQLVEDLIYSYFFEESSNSTAVNNTANIRVEKNASIVRIHSLEEFKDKASVLSESTYILLNSSILENGEPSSINLSSDDIPQVAARTNYKIFSKMDLNETPIITPVTDALLLPVNRFVLIVTGEESVSYVAEPTGNQLIDGLLAPVGIFFKVATKEEELTYISEASMGNPLFDALMLPVGRFVLIATGEENVSYAAEPTGNQLIDGLLAPVGIFFKVFTGEEELSYIAVSSMGNPLFDTLMIPVGKFVLISTGEKELSYIVE